MVTTPYADASAQLLKRRFVAGLDLGQASDFTALSVAELLPTNPFEAHVRHLERFPLQTPYPQIVSAVHDRVAAIRAMGALLLVVDQTGVGRAVVDLFRVAGLKVPMWPVTIATSAMGQARRDPHTHDWTVPKKDLVAALQTLAHSDRLKVAQSLREAETLTDELTKFRMKYTAAANITYEAWREGDHDDLVLAVAMTCWASLRWANPGGLI